MRTIFWAGLAAFILDQLSKYLVIHVMALWQVRSIDILPPLLNFRYGENRGINFGLFGSGSEASRWILIILALAICVGVVIWARRNDLGLVAKIGAGALSILSEPGSPSPAVSTTTIDTFVSSTSAPILISPKCANDAPNNVSK